MIDGIDSVENVAVTALNTPVIVLLAVAVLALTGAIIIMIWLFLRGSNKDKAMFASVLEQTSRMNAQLHVTNTRNTDTLDRVGDEMVQISINSASQNSLTKEMLALLQSYGVMLNKASATSMAEHGKLEGQVSTMRSQMENIIEAVADLKAQNEEIQKGVKSICDKDQTSDAITQKILEEIQAQNIMLQELIASVSAEPDPDTTPHPDITSH